MEKMTGRGPQMNSPEIPEGCGPLEFAVVLNVGQVRLAAE
jgi:hypothetical protein